MTSLPYLIALAVTVAGAAYLYFGAPRQLWLTRALPAGVTRLGGGALLSLGWVIWFMLLHATTALFVVLTLTMTTLILLPAGVALFRPAMAAATRRARP